jgi:hypothetical protein
MTRTCEQCGRVGEDVVPHGNFGDYCTDTEMCELSWPPAMRQAVKALQWLDAHEDEYREGARNVAFALGWVACIEWAVWTNKDRTEFAQELHAIGLWKGGEWWDPPTCHRCHADPTVTPGLCECRAAPASGKLLAVTPVTRKGGE